MREDTALEAKKWYFFYKITPLVQIPPRGEVTRPSFPPPNGFCGRRDLYSPGLKCRIPRLMLSHSFRGGAPTYAYINSFRTKNAFLPLYPTPPPPPPRGMFYPVRIFPLSGFAGNGAPFSSLEAIWVFTTSQTACFSREKKGEHRIKRRRNIFLRLFLQTTLFHTLKLINSIAFFLHFQMWHYPPPLPPPPPSVPLARRQDVWRNRQFNSFFFRENWALSKNISLPHFFLSLKGKTT